jgi:hypothetical protein
VTGIVSLITIVLSIAFWAWKRRAARKDDPTEQNREGYKQVDSEIARRDGAKATADLHTDLDELDRLERAARVQHGTASDQGL